MLNQITNITNLPNLKNKCFGGAYSIHDPELIEARDTIISSWSSVSVSHEKIKQDYFSEYKEWVNTSQNLIGFDQFSNPCFTQGTTESFAQFYLRFKNRRLRLARGEYFYHQMMYKLRFTNQFAWLEDEPLKSGDVLLISAPFSETGNIPDKLDEWLEQCDNLGIPVMLDLAYINLGTKFEIDLSHPCIEYVVTSLSKYFPLELHRIGIRWQRTKHEDQIYVINEYDYNYINILSVWLGLNMMQKFSPFWLQKKYHQYQIDWCNKLNLEPSKSIIFGIDKQGQYPDYNRGTKTNRLCFSRIWDGRMTYNENDIVKTN